MLFYIKQNHANDSGKRWSTGTIERSCHDTILPNDGIAAAKSDLSGLSRLLLPCLSQDEKGLCQIWTRRNLLKEFRIRRTTPSETCDAVQCILCA